MASYVVMEPPAGSKDETLFIKDGFAPLGFLLPPLWLAWNRLWLEAATVGLLLLVLERLSGMGGFGAVAALLSFGLCVLVGLEGTGLRVAALERRNWHQAAYLDAKNDEDAEARYAFGRFGETV